MTTTDRNQINVLDLPARGPWANGMRVGNLVFTSGQVPVDPTTGKVAGPGMPEQVRQSMDNIIAILAEVGADSSSIVKVTVYLRNESDFDAMNLAYGGYFPVGKHPARTTVTVANLPIIDDVMCRVIIEAIAVLA